MEDIGKSAPDIVNLQLPGFPVIGEFNTAIDLLKELKNLLIHIAQGKTKPLGASEIQ